MLTTAECPVCGYSHPVEVLSRTMVYSRLTNAYTQMLRLCRCRESGVVFSVTEDLGAVKDAQ